MTGVGHLPPVSRAAQSGRCWMNSGRLIAPAEAAARRHERTPTPSRVPPAGCRANAISPERGRRAGQRLKWLGRGLFVGSASVVVSCGMSDPVFSHRRIGSERHPSHIEVAEYLAVGFMPDHETDPSTTPGKLSRRQCLEPLRHRLIFSLADALVNSSSIAIIRALPPAYRRPDR